MNRFILLMALLLVPAVPASATFSIVAIDPVTGDLGIAVASRISPSAQSPWADGLALSPLPASTSATASRVGAARQGLTGSR